MLPIAIILLAAGESRRLGRPKQLLTFGESTLLRHAAETALAAKLGPVIVVLGAAEKACQETLSALPLTIVANPTWHEGMGSSIATGMQAVRETEHRAAIIMLCDQPMISPQMLRALAEHQHTTGQSIVASQFRDTLGPPALFTATHFPQLRRLRGAEGARKLFQDAPALATVACPEAALDIDTEQDLSLLDSSSATTPPSSPAPDARKIHPAPEQPAVCRPW